MVHCRDGLEGDPRVAARPTRTPSHECRRRWRDLNQEEGETGRKKPIQNFLGSQSEDSWWTREHGAIKNSSSNENSRKCDGLVCLTCQVRRWQAGWKEHSSGMLSFHLSILPFSMSGSFFMYVASGSQDSCCTSNLPSRQGRRQRHFC